MGGNIAASTTQLKGESTLRRRPERTSALRLPAQFFHQLSHLQPAVTATDQKREQAAFAHRDRQTGQLPRALRGHGARLDPGVDPFLLERPADRVLRRAALDALRLQIAEQAGWSLAARRAQRGVLLGE